MPSSVGGHRPAQRLERSASPEHDTHFPQPPHVADREPIGHVAFYRVESPTESLSSKIGGRRDAVWSSGISVSHLLAGPRRTTTPAHAALTTLTG